MNDADSGEKCNLTDVPMADVIRSTQCVVACEGLDPTKIGAALDAMETAVSELGGMGYWGVMKLLRDALDAVRKPSPSSEEPDTPRCGNCGLAIYFETDGPEPVNCPGCNDRLNSPPSEDAGVRDTRRPVQVAAAFMLLYDMANDDGQPEYFRHHAKELLAGRGVYLASAARHLKTKSSPSSEEPEAPHDDVASAVGVLADALDDAEPKPPIRIALENSWVETTDYEHVANRDPARNGDPGMVLCEIPGGFAMSTLWQPVGVASAEELVGVKS